MQHQIIDHEGNIYILTEEEYLRASKDGFRWADEPTRLLLATYKRHENLLHTGKLSVKKFWEMISNKLKERAYDVTGQQCKSKINRLKKTYKNVKDYNNKSGNNKRTWLYFEIMDEMFGQKPWVTPILTLDSSNRNILSPASSTSNNNSNISSNTYNEISSSPQSSKSSRKRQKVTQDTALEKLLAVMEENKEERKKMHNEAVERQDRMLNILEKIANK
ncbi:PREDICTED: uncharacterized protein LOC108770291 isoform X2 [Trachymyrmex cornetzi]|uniref:uncharacterized protein LOC108762643 isoform X2 n=1 Tax=Trachymyrmex cornetzi TaxID=471704 RepID=UPI00084F2A6C|nr:PREDICTED: uncharacterized protein LOC108762643 isoform X2 [Trachymyrmex cornetzi]XP_018377298.1 PREDICTED: uncharacterized protein LOC108770291 isoform X2 [Trachymyrmex cornetzi]